MTGHPRTHTPHRAEPASPQATKHHHRASSAVPGGTPLAPEVTRNRRASLATRAHRGTLTVPEVTR
ncbi:hypothetical protein GCM10023148_37510 [Actinokineospora soli]